MVNQGCSLQNFSINLQTREGAIAECNYPFNSVAQAIAFLNLNNPARQRFPNLLEPEFGNNCYHEDFSGHSPRDLWASVAAGVFQVLKDQPYESRVIWITWHRLEKPAKYSIEDLAKDAKKDVRKIYRILKEVREELESELFRRGLLNPSSLD